MATVNEKMTALADAVRGKTGDTDKLTLDEMTSAITNYTTDATAVATQIFIDETAYVDGKKVIGTFTIDDEIDEQLELLNQISAALINKGSNENSGSNAASIDTCSFTLGTVGSDVNLKYYCTVWENGKLITKTVPSGSNVNNIPCNGYIIADTTTGSINKSAVISMGVTLIGASSDSTVLIFEIKMEPNTSNTILIMPGASNM